MCLGVCWGGGVWIPGRLGSGKGHIRAEISKSLETNEASYLNIHLENIPE